MTDHETELMQAMQVRAVLNANPDLPVMLLAPSVGGEYESYYHEGVSAFVERVLMPREVGRELGTDCGLNEERYYTDGDGAAQDVAEWLFEGWYDAARESGLFPTWRGIPDDDLTAFCGLEYAYEEGASLAVMADRLAGAMVEAMPWREYVIVRAAL